MDKYPDFKYEIARLRELKASGGSTCCYRNSGNSNKPISKLELTIKTKMLLKTVLPGTDRIIRRVINNLLQTEVRGQLQVRVFSTDCMV